MKLLLTAVFFLATLPAAAQITPGKLSFALPEHPGKLVLDQSGFKISELSTKSSGSEFGIRAEDGDLHLLGFLFLWPEKPHLTSTTCRDEMLRAEAPAKLSLNERAAMKSASGTDIALALLAPESGKFSTVRAFIAQDELCADLSFTLNKPLTVAQLPLDKIKAILNTVIFNPAARPTFLDTFAYATVAWDHHDLAGATLAYKAALSLTETSDDPLKWRRVTTDQLSMALGMSGDLKGSRKVNEAAIAKDSGYPMYYYNLACADAEAGDADGARAHLQQAFDRKANTLPGEKLPEPASDDSFLKLKSNKNFWTFVQTLNP